MEKKHIILTVILLGILSVTGISYAIWQLTKTQTGENIVTSGCFKIEWKENNNINLERTYPISDEEGRKLVPYEFTIINKCDNYATYHVNLEELITEQKRLSHDYIKIEIENKISSLKDLKKVSSTIDNSDCSHEVAKGMLEPNEEKKYTMRLWMDYETPAIENVMESNFESKVTITSTYQNDIIIPYLDNVKVLDLPTKEDKYAFEKAECNNNIKLNWNDELWNYSLSSTKINSNQNVCKIYFKTINYEVVLYSETATFENNKVLTNLIHNGTFENGLDNWIGGKVGNIKTEGCLSGKCFHNDDTTSQASRWLKQLLSKKPNLNDHIFYGGFSHIIDHRTNGMYIGISVFQNNSYKIIQSINLDKNQNKYEHFGDIYKVSESPIYLQVGSSVAGTAEGYFDNLYVINLTDTFGSGNEPTKEWVNKYIPYFETTSNISVGSIEKLETKKFKYTLKKAVNIECTNAEYKIENNTLELSNAIGNVYCKIK